MPKRKSLLPIQDHSLYPDVVSFLQANREACLKSLLADDDRELCGHEQRLRVNVFDDILAALTPEPVTSDLE